MKSEIGATAAHSIKYRPDIDGLRALAILPVILYHAKLACPGGFVGVDVFFVISGFLISSLILKEMADGTFSLVNFWERRIRRILPALSVVVMATFVAASYLFLPEDFAFVGRSVAAQAVFGANFFFWKQSGYFAPGSDTKPLLHTWSLAVEEQCYLLLPLLLLFLARFRKNPVLQAVAILTLGSFVLSIFGSHSANNQKSTFFLLPTRSWELTLGVLLAALRGRISAGRPLRELSGWLGIVLIAWPVFYYSTATRFPGLAALPPCLGTALVIFSSEAKLSSVGHLLAFRPVVFVGLISYSLYLWHWPLLAFATYLSKQPQGDAIQIRLLAASFVLAVLSWQFIEKPFRQRRVFSQRPQIFGFAMASLAALLILGLVVGKHNGFPSRFPTSVMTYAQARFHTPYPGTTDMGKSWEDHLVKFSVTQTNPPVEVLIWGDSHATALSPVIDTLCQKQSWRDIVASGGGVPPVLGSFQIKNSMETPAMLAASVLKYITEHPPREVIMAAKWSGYTASESFISNTVAAVRAAQDLGVRVYVVKDVPIPGYDVPRFAALAAMHGGDVGVMGVTKHKHEKTNRELEPMFDQIAQLGATVLDPAPYFLGTNGMYQVEKDGKILYFDADHLTVDGSMMLAPLFEPLLHAE